MAFYMHIDFLPRQDMVSLNKYHAGNQCWSNNYKQRNKHLLTCRCYYLLCTRYLKIKRLFFFILGFIINVYVNWDVNPDQMHHNLRCQIPYPPKWHIWGEIFRAKNTCYSSAAISIEVQARAKPSPIKFIRANLWARLWTSAQKYSKVCPTGSSTPCDSHSPSPCGGTIWILATF